MAAKSKKKSSKPDIKFEFANSEFADSFALTIQTTFPNCEFLVSGDSISLWAPKKVLTSIKEISEYDCYQRRKISIYTPC